MQFPLSESELISKPKSGEDSFTQYKREVKNAESLAEEMVAFANGGGGCIFVGIDEDDTGRGKVVGIENLKTLNNHISNASSENCLPALFPKVQTLVVEGKTVMVIFIEEGNQKLYRTKAGKYLMRAGADKRAASQEELSRLLQGSGFFHIEEVAVRGAAIETELDKVRFTAYYEKYYQKTLASHFEESGQTLSILCNNMGIAKEGNLNLVGLLFFGKNIDRFRPLLQVACVSFYGNNIAKNRYIANDNISGTLDIQFERSLYFITNHLLKKQPAGEGFNSVGQLEISTIALQEALANALVHRDYNKASTIRIFVFQERVEIISPGALPNHLTIEQIKHGNAVARNPISKEYAKRLLPYRGIDSGIRRILEEHPRTEFENDIEG